MLSRTIMLLVCMQGLFLIYSCKSRLIETDPLVVADTGAVTITVDAETGNKGLLDFEGPVFIHMGLITDSSEYPNEWRFVKFKWGSMEQEARATELGGNKWTYTIPGIRSFFGVG